MPQYTHSFSITPADGDDLPKPARILYAAGAGNVKIELDDDTSPIIVAMLAGQFLKDFQIRKIWATDTTATGLIGFF